MSDKLIDRLEKCTGPDRELDGAIWLALDETAAYKCWSVRGMKYGGHVHTKAEKRAAIKRSSEWQSPTYTASLDATIALVERKLPDWVWSASSTGVAWVMSFKAGEGDDFHTGSLENRPAIALLICLLRALSSPEGTK